MRKLLLIVGIVSLSGCALSLLISAFNRFGYYNVLDGSSALYTRLHQNMTVYFITGIVLAVIGIICMLICFKR